MRGQLQAGRVRPRASDTRTKSAGVHKPSTREPQSAGCGQGLGGGQAAGRAARAPLYQELVGTSPLLPVAAARRHRLAAAVGRASHDAAPARQLSAAARCLCSTSLRRWLIPLPASPAAYKPARARAARGARGTPRQLALSCGVAGLASRQAQRTPRPAPAPTWRGPTTTPSPARGWLRRCQAWAASCRVSAALVRRSALLRAWLQRQRSLAAAAPSRGERAAQGRVRKKQAGRA